MVLSMHGDMALKRRVFDLERSCVREETKSSSNMRVRLNADLPVECVCVCGVCVCAGCVCRVCVCEDSGEV